MTRRDFVALSLLPTARWRGTRALSALPPGSLHDEGAFELLVEFCAGAGRGTAGLADRLRDAADDTLERAARQGIAAVVFPDPGYPELLRAIREPPVVLWVAGDRRLDRPAVAVVGARAASTGGLEVAGRLARELANAGLAIVSGLARGCDAAAHLGALEAHGTTIAVLGCGADVVYPPEHRGLYDRIRTNGAIVSELSPGTPPLPGHFPLRNRIISGLSRAVVIVEASEKSGSLITAACALEQGRDVMAVPGSTLSSRHRGCHALLRDGARLVETAADVLEELGWTASSEVENGNPPDGNPPDALLELLGSEEDSDLDRLAVRSGLSIPALLERLMALELSGKVRRAPGGRFVRGSR
jgi:DNA processing protein